MPIANVVRTFLTRKEADFSDCCCVRPDGLVYVIANKWADFSFQTLHRRVYAIAPNGEIIKRVDINSLDSHLNAVVWANGTLFAVGNSGLYKISMEDGKCEQILKKKDFEEFGRRGPRDIAIGEDKVIYAISGNAQRILKITLEDDVKVQTVAGTTHSSHSGSESTFKHLSGVHIGGDAHLYVTMPHKIQWLDLSTFKVKTLAGNSQSGNLDGSDVDCRFDRPVGIKQDSFGQFYVSDTSNYSIRKISQKRRNVPHMVTTLNLRWIENDVNKFTSFEWAFSTDTRVCGVDRLYCWLYVKCDAGLLQVDIKKPDAERHSYVHPKLEYKEPEHFKQKQQPILKINWTPPKTPFASHGGSHMRSLRSPRSPRSPMTTTTPTSVSPTDLEQATPRAHEGSGKPTHLKGNNIEGEDEFDSEEEVEEAAKELEGEEEESNADTLSRSESRITNETDETEKDIWELAKTDDLELFIETFQSNPDVLNLKDEQYGATLCHYAAGWGREEILAILIESGADIDMKSANFYSPLHTAASRGQHKTVQMLIDANCDINLKGKNGHSALHVAANRESATADYLKVVKALVDGNISTKAKDESERTALDLARERKNQNIIQYLIRAKKFISPHKQFSASNSETESSRIMRRRPRAAYHVRSSSTSGSSHRQKSRRARNQSCDSGLMPKIDYSQSDTDSDSSTEPTDWTDTGDESNTTDMLSDFEAKSLVSLHSGGRRGGFGVKRKSAGALKSLSETTASDGTKVSEDELMEVQNEEERKKQEDEERRKQEIEEEEKRERLQFAKDAAAGIKFRKHGRHGRPHSRDIYVDLKNETISWKKGKYLKFQNISHITVGKCSKVLHRTAARDAREERCFSIYQLGTNKTLDLEAPSSTIRNLWYKWLLHYTKKFWGSEGYITSAEPKRSPNIDININGGKQHEFNSS